MTVALYVGVLARPSTLAIVAGIGTLAFVGFG